jgi:hypothetical protein
MSDDKDTQPKIEDEENKDLGDDVADDEVRDGPLLSRYT